MSDDSDDNVYVPSQYDWLYATVPATPPYRYTFVPSQKPEAPAAEADDGVDPATKELIESALPKRLSEFCGYCATPVSSAVFVRMALMCKGCNRPVGGL